MTTINTDLLTPLGAYLRLRDAGRASFILESVERGRLGRNSWMGAGSRLVSFDEADELGLPVVGYLAYDHVARLEPTVPLPDGRPRPSREPVHRLRHARPFRPRRRHRRGARRRPGRGRRPSRGGDPLAARGTWHRRPDHPLSRPGALRGDGAQRQAAHRRGRRLPVRSVSARRAPDLGDTARSLPSAASREPVALPLSARARRRLAHRLVARTARGLRKRDGELLPDRRHDRTDRGRRRAPALLREGQGRARHARRPRAQRPLARLSCRHCPRRARTWRSSASRTSRTSSPRSSGRSETA